MQDVNIHRLRTHYRLRGDALSAQRRLAQLNTAVLEEAFALATTKLAVPNDAELCIRKLSVPVSLRSSSVDTALARDWIVAVAHEISRTAREGSNENVVFYRSRRQALIDMALRIAAGDLTRCWAWRQLGLWLSRDVTGEQALLELSRSLCGEPTAVISTLREIAEAGLLPQLIKRFREDQWESLALAVLSEAGAEMPNGEARPVPSSRAMSGAMRVLNASRLVQSIGLSGISSVTSTKVCRAVAVLAMFEVEPVLINSEASQAIINIVAEAIQTRSSAGLPTSPGLTESTNSNPPKQGSGIDHSRSGEIDSEDDAPDAPLDLRQRGFTQFGGLLFLLHLFDELDLPAKILEHPHLPSRPFVWVVHQLALALADIEADDPAALAFAGLPPNAAPPLQPQEPVNDDEAAALKIFTRTITRRLRILLKPTKQSDRGLLEFVYSRRAEVVADPGWIEVRLSLDDVSTAIRRSGLDLDPGYVPWLGVVLKFIYE